MLKQIYDRFVDENGNVFRKTKNGLVLCKLTKNGIYLAVNIKNSTKKVLVHRLIWEAFNGEIDASKEIDHIDSNSLNNKLSNLRCVTSLENMHNMNSVKRRWTEFGKKFYEHYHLSKFENKGLYSKEHKWYRRHGKCRWEV